MVAVFTLWWLMCTLALNRDSVKVYANIIHFTVDIRHKGLSITYSKNLVDASLQGWVVAMTFWKGNNRITIYEVSNTTRTGIEWVTRIYLYDGPSHRRGPLAIGFHAYTCKGNYSSGVDDVTSDITCLQESHRAWTSVGTICTQPYRRKHKILYL